MAEAATEWWRGGVIYEIYPRSFQDTNGDGIGDLQGVTRRLGHVADLGVDAIWLTPFYVSPMRDFGYDVADYRAVDPIFGTLADFDALLAEAHRLGLKVLIDQVVSHTSDRHAWFRESRASRDNARKDWYVWAERKDDGSPPNNWLSVFGGAAWQWDTPRRQYYLHNFLTSQPDLNLHNPQVQDALLDVMRFWLDRGVDGFRLDALNFAFQDPLLRDNPAAADPTLSEHPLSNPYAFQKHLYDKSQPEVLPLLQRIRRLLNQYGATTTIGEIGDGGERSLQLMTQYSAGGDKLHMCYSFDFLGAELSAAHIRRTIERFEAGAGDAWPCWAFSNHDCVRHPTRFAHRAEDRAAIAAISAVLLLSLRGSVCLYQGEELGLGEAAVAFEDLQDPAGIAFWPDFKGRDGCRTPMPWNGAEKGAGFTTGKPWLPTPAEHLPLSVADEAGDDGSTLALYRRMLAIRKASPALRLGSIRCATPSADLLVLERTVEGETVIAAFNLGPTGVAGPDPAGLETLIASQHHPDGIGPLGYWLGRRR